MRIDDEVSIHIQLSWLANELYSHSWVSVIQPVQCELLDVDVKWWPSPQVKPLHLVILMLLYYGAVFDL